MAAQPGTPRKSLQLTEEEALALLDMCLCTEAPDDKVRRETMRRVGDLCREFIREGRHSVGVRWEPGHSCTQTVLTLTNSRMPNAASSRP